VNTRPNRELTPIHMGEMMYMRERVFWQSRAGLVDPPKLVDLEELAADIKRTWQ
jgi:hypothetical protein